MFEDVPAEHWASKYIINGKLYVKPYEDGLFKPEQPITRLEFANATAELLRFVAKSNEVIPKDVMLTDIENLDADSIENIKFLVGLGLINGYDDNTFRPNKTLTRAEASKILSISLIFIDDEVNKAMADTEGWYICDPISSWNSPVQYDLEGNLKINISKNMQGYELYYNGEYFMTLNRDIRTMKREKLYTNDGKEWDVKWFGSDVVEYVEEDENVKIIDHYQEKEYTFTNQYVSKDEAIEILEDLFPYADFDFVAADGRIWFKQYAKNTEKEMSTMTITNYLFENEILQIDLEELNSSIWMEEVNGNNQERAGAYMYSK